MNKKSENDRRNGEIHVRLNEKEQILLKQVCCGRNISTSEAIRKGIASLYDEMIRDQLYKNVLKKD